LRSFLAHKNLLFFSIIIIEKEVLVANELGISKHRKSGHVVNNKHFTGKKGSKNKKKQKLTAKQKRMKRNTHINKYI
jgi:hypothetical protein